MFTFFLLFYGGIVLCSVLQSSIRAIVVSVFLYRFLLRFESPKLARLLFLGYLLAVLGFNLFLAIDSFTANGWDCTEETDWQILALITIDTFQSLLLLAVTISMYKQS